MRRCLQGLGLAIIMAAFFAPVSAEAEPFRFMRIGDKDGFGFLETKNLVRWAFLTPDPPSSWWSLRPNRPNRSSSIPG